MWKLSDAGRKERRTLPARKTTHKVGTGGIRIEKIIPNERRPGREGRDTRRSGILRPGRSPADVGRGAGGRSERLLGPAPLPARPNLPGLPQWLPPGPGADRGSGTSGGAGAPGGPSAQGGSATGVPLGGSPALPAGVPDHPAAVCPPLPRRAGHGRL